MFSFGFLAVMLVIYLAELQFTSTEIGLLFTLTLLGDAIISIFLTSHADRYGRRFCLLIGSLLAIGTSIIFAFSNNFYVLLFSAIVGVISPSGSEIGPFMAIEISAISQVTDASARTKILAWYNLFGSFANALGALTCGFLIKYLESHYQYSLLVSCQYILVLYGCLQAIVGALFYSLGSEIEVPPITDEQLAAKSLTSQFLGLHKSKWIVFQLSLLFMLDSFAGSFVLQSIISNWFYDVYHTSSEKIGTMLFFCNIVAGVSALFAAKLADLIGLISTMFITHLPSNILLILVPLMPNEVLAIAMLCARFSISQMDVPTRNAYVQGVVDPDERSAANGVTNVVRSIGASTGPYFAGLLFAQKQYSSFPWFIAGGLKIIYDILLLSSFVSVVPDTEREQAAASSKKRNAITELTPLNGKV